MYIYTYPSPFAYGRRKNLTIPECKMTEDRTKIENFITKYKLTYKFYCLREKTGKILSYVIGNRYLHVFNESLFFECVRQVRRDV